MSALALGDLVAQNIAGQYAAQRVIDKLPGTFDADLLYAQVVAIVALDEPERLRSFCRQIQKALERTP